MCDIIDVFVLIASIFAMIGFAAFLILMIMLTIHSGNRMAFEILGEVIAGSMVISGSSIFAITVFDK